MQRCHGFIACTALILIDISVNRWTRHFTILYEGNHSEALVETDKDSCVHTLVGNLCREMYLLHVLVSKWQWFSAVLCHFNQRGHQCSLSLLYFCLSASLSLPHTRTNKDVHSQSSVGRDTHMNSSIAFLFNTLFVSSMSYLLWSGNGGNHQTKQCSQFQMGKHVTEITNSPFIIWSSNVWNEKKLKEKFNLGLPQTRRSRLVPNLKTNYLSQFGNTQLCSVSVPHLPIFCNTTCVLLPLPQWWFEKMLED